MYNSRRTKCMTEVPGDIQMYHAEGIGSEGERIEICRRNAGPRHAPQQRRIARIHLSGASKVVCSSLGRCNDTAMATSSLSTKEPLDQSEQFGGTTFNDPEAGMLEVVLGSVIRDL